MPPSFLQRLAFLFRLHPRSPTVADIRAVPGRKPKPTPEQLERLRAEALQLIAPLARPTFIPRVQKVLPADAANLSIAGSRFCGPAALKPDEPWPACKCGTPMQLFLQLSSADLPAAAGLPFGEGLLQLFTCTDCDNGYEPFSATSLRRILPQSPDLVLASRPETPESKTFPARVITGWESPTDDLPNWEEPRLVPR